MRTMRAMRAVRARAERAMHAAESMRYRWSCITPSLLVLFIACMPRSRHDDSHASATQMTGAELTMPGWTKVTIPPLPPLSNDLLRPTSEERAADAAELPCVQVAAEVTIEAAPMSTPLAEPPLPDWVPVSGRLTIVGAGNLARNLGEIDDPDAGGN